MFVPEMMITNQILILKKTLKKMENKFGIMENISDLY
jgi:hypothetical protein